MAAEARSSWTTTPGAGVPKAYSSNEWQEVWEEVNENLSLWVPPDLDPEPEPEPKPSPFVYTPELVGEAWAFISRECGEKFANTEVNVQQIVDLYLHDLQLKSNS